jgi:tetratricopeptide (TPR) repeat protein
MNAMPAVASSNPPMARFSSICLLVLFLVLIWLSARAGFASLLYTYSAASNQLPAANAAVSLSPADPEAHYLRGAILEAGGDLAAAISEYNQAIERRPDDYALWLGLARAQELSGQSSLAIASARQATQLAPYYAQPHWQLGNLLVRAGRTEEGFGELRLAGSSDPGLLPPVIDLAWQLSQGNVQMIVQRVQPSTAAAHSAVADYFRKRGQVAGAIEVLRGAGSGAEEYRRQFLDELLKAKRYTDAFALWSVEHPAANAEPDVPGISNQGFEQERRLDEPGFDWRRELQAPTVTLSLDPANPQEGKASLKVEFNGDSDPATQVISQLVLVQPNIRYQLKFASRTENIVSGGLPIVVVRDADSQTVLGKTEPLPQAASNWLDYSIDFNSIETTHAILISVQRERCADSRCPIFGRLWLDNFSLRKF